MKDKMSLVLPITAGIVMLAVILFVLPDSLFSGFGSSKKFGSGTGEEERVAGRNKNFDAEPLSGGIHDPSAELLAALLARLSSKDAKPNEAILTFKSDEALKAFLSRAADSGLKVLGTIDGLNAVRVGYDDLRSLRNELRDYAGDYAGWGANYYVHIPGVPPPEDRPQQAEVGFGDGMLAFMGVKGDISAWGKGVTIAILDSGVSSHPAFAQGQVKYIDIGMGTTGTSEADAHATAVASLAAGNMPGATGLAPASTLLSIRVTNSEGTSDIFTLAQGIQAAVDAGARVINISLGSYQDSSVLSRMIEYAETNGSVIVASAGNDQATQMTWPAADSRVISVGAVDALGQQLTWSNSGDTLAVSAPGLGLSAAWPGNQIVSFDGTSGSAPVISGAIAALMSLDPTLTARQATSLITTYSADAGAPGHDPDYGNGTIDMGYALNYNNFDYIDTSISSQFFSPEEGRVEFVIQNRSGQGVGDMTLSINAAGARQNIDVPWLASGERWSYIVPVDRARLATEGELTYTSQLRNPNGIIDQNPGNNGKASVVFKVAGTE
jgi:Subtilase family